MEIGYAPIVSPWDTTASSSSPGLDPFTTPKSGELGDSTAIAGKLHSLHSCMLALIFWHIEAGHADHCLDSHSATLTLLCVKLT